MVLKNNSCINFGNLTFSGANLVLACRDIKKGEEVTSDIKKKTGNPSVRCERLDLTNCQSIIDFVNRFKQKGKLSDIDKYVCLDNLRTFLY